MYEELQELFMWCINNSLLELCLRHYEARCNRLSGKITHYCLLTCQAARVKKLEAADKEREMRRIQVLIIYLTPLVHILSCIFMRLCASVHVYVWVGVRDRQAKEIRERELELKKAEDDKRRADDRARQEADEARRQAELARERDEAARRKDELKRREDELRAEQVRRMPIILFL